MTKTAVEHSRECISLQEQAGNRFSAGQSRFSFANLLRRTNRLPDAMAYARAARDDFASYGGHGAAEVAKAERLIAGIESAIAATRENA